MFSVQKSRYQMHFKRCQLIYIVCILKISKTLKCKVTEFTFSYLHYLPDNVLAGEGGMEDTGVVKGVVGADTGTGVLGGPGGPAELVPTTGGAVMMGSEKGVSAELEVATGLSVELRPATGCSVGPGEGTDREVAVSMELWVIASFSDASGTVSSSN